MAQVMRPYVQGYIDSAIGITSEWTDADIEDVVACVLKRHAIPQWWDTPLPTLDSRTARDLWSGSATDRKRLIDHVIGYLIPSFS